MRRPTPATTHAVRFTVGAPEKAAFESNPAFLSISPDGSKLAFMPRTGPTLMGSIRHVALDSLPGLPELPRRSRERNGASQPFWSPDSQFVGFFAGGQLKKIAVSGGPPQTLSEAPSSNTAGASAGGSWSRDGVILFTANIKSGSSIESPNPVALPLKLRHLIGSASRNRPFVAAVSSRRQALPYLCVWQWRRGANAIHRRIPGFQGDES